MSVSISTISYLSLSNLRNQGKACSKCSFKQTVIFLFILIDFLVQVDSKVQGGGNAGNGLTCAARLGLNSRLISKLANDAQGRGILEELEADGVDTSRLVVSKDGNSPFTYIIVDNKTRRNIPILLDAEKKRDGLDELLNFAEYVAWTEAPSIPSALVSMLMRLPNLKFVIVTLGDDGCVMLGRSLDVLITSSRSPPPGCLQPEEVDVDSSLQLLKQRVDGSSTIPTCISSKSVVRLSAKGMGAVNGRLLVRTAEKIPPSELIDTIGAGDAFIGATLYAICAGMPPEKMLPFASQVVCASCRALGARTGLPWRTDPCITPHLL
ncbi:hypothetical protein MKX03_036002 [Papaver bracteatum]|nr:hypothetical protein MKX03_036002 [Papaver bracteatum]